MSQTVFEYVDEAGQSHQVDSLGQVPKQYMKTMLVIGGEPDEPKTAKPAQAQKPAAPDPNTWSGYKPVFLTPPAMPKALSGINPNVVLPIVVAVLLWRTKSYFLKIVLITVTVFWGFYHLYSWFEGSRFAQTGDKVQKSRPR
ncbi:MAG: hypothetical protein WC728_17455 [Elusimicrobiota bacterium]